MSMLKKEKNNPQGVADYKYKKYVIILSLVAVALLATNVFAFLRGGESKNNENTRKDEFTLLNPARKFVDQKDLIINFQPLRDYLQDKYEIDQDISIYFEYQPTGSNISINKDAEFYPASLLKVPVAMAVARKIERGEWKWINELVLMSTDKNDKFGTLFKEPTNSAHAIEDLVRRSLVDSDNTAHYILVRNLDVEEVKDVYNHMGLEGFLETEGSLSAKRYSVMFRALHNSSYLSEEHSQKLLSYLTESSFKEYIQSGLPENVSFSHKIGISAREKVFIDSGIIYAQNRPYILTVMTKNKIDQQAREIMKDISEKVFNYVENYVE